AIPGWRRSTTRPRSTRTYSAKETLVSTSNNTPDYTATIQGWWDNAEDATPSIGDTVISRDDDEVGGSIYTVYVWTEEDAEWRSGARDDRRVLRRATPPEPEQPAWADAPAVIVSRVKPREVFVRNDETGMWDGSGTYLTTSTLAFYSP